MLKQYPSESGPATRCTNCGQVKFDKDFNKAGSGRRRNDVCWDCRRAYNHGRYLLKKFLRDKSEPEILRWYRSLIGKTDEEVQAQDSE